MTRPKLVLFVTVSSGVACLLISAAVLREGARRADLRLPYNANCDVLERLVVKDAPSAAAEDKKRGERRLVGVQGYAIDLPGVPESRGDWLPSNYQVQVLPCTSDGIVSRKHGQLNDKAWAYAAAYNQARLALPGAQRPEYTDEDGA